VVGKKSICFDAKILKKEEKRIFETIFLCLKNSLKLPFNE